MSLYGMDVITISLEGDESGCKRNMDIEEELHVNASGGTLHIWID